MKVALAVLIALSLAPFCNAADWPACADVPKCKDGEDLKLCCDEVTKLVWQRDGCKAEQYSIVSGDPDSTGPFVIRFRWSEGLQVPPHVHPVDEHVTIIRGVSWWGMGEKIDENATWRMSEGMSATLMKMMPHYAIVKAPGGEIQIHGYGPFATYWVGTPCEPDPAVTTGVDNSPRKGKPAPPKP